VPATTTCQHGLDASTCLICATLAPSPVRTASATPSKRKKAKIPAGRPEVITGGPPPRRGIGLLGGVVILAALVVVAWFLIHLVWGILRLFELALVGAVCGVVGYRIGVVVGRHRR
jgi:hypothetical protein